MKTSPAVSVVIPVYNEAESIVQLQAELEEALAEFDYELVFVDDGSTDNSVARIRPHERVQAISFVQNRGQSAALYVGIQQARGEVIVLIDSDLQNDPRDIPRLLVGLKEGADLVCGYRLNRRDHWFKLVQSRIANSVRSRFTGDGVRDTGCTLKAMRRECREALIPFYGMHRFIPALIKSGGYRVTEMPVSHRPRQYGQSKYRFGNRAFRATVDLLGVCWLLSRQIRVQFDREDGCGRGKD